jgi:hypothetical protein
MKSPWAVILCKFNDGSVEPFSRRLGGRMQPMRVRFGRLDGLQRVVNRPSGEINMRLLSLNRGAIHGYRYQDRRACNTVE